MDMKFDLNDRRLMSFLLIGGGLLLLGFWQYGIGVMWPLFVIAPGVFMLYYALAARTDDDAEMIFPGVIVTATGALLLYQSITGNWHSWAYAWAMYPALTGYAIQWRAERVDRYRGEYHMGRNMMRYGLMALIGLAVIFEFTIFNSGSAQVLGIALLGVGVFLLFTGGKSGGTTIDFGELLKPKNDSKAKYDDTDAA